MTTKITRLSMKFKIHTVPTDHFHSIAPHEVTLFGNQLSTIAFGPNIVVMNKHSSEKLGLNDGRIVFWALLTFCSDIDDEKNFNNQRLVQVVINENVNEDSLFMSEDLLFNLSEVSKVEGRYSSITPQSQFLILINENVGERTGPVVIKAKKVAIALFKAQTFLETSLVDKVLQKYFSFTRYMNHGDVFSVKIDSGFVNEINDKTETLYCKVCDVEHYQEQQTKVSKLRGFFVDSSVEMVQVTSCQGYLPSKRVPSKLNFDKLLKSSELIEHLSTYGQLLVPESLVDKFNTITRWIEPFISETSQMKESNLQPVFLVSGAQGSGKSLLLQTVSQHLGLSYCRVDCVTLSAVIPGQAEAKMKAVFSQLSAVAPCLLHLVNIETLCQDGEGKEDVRVVSCFKDQLKFLSNTEWPVVIVASSRDAKNLSISMRQLFLDQTSTNTPDCQQRQQVLAWILWSVDVKMSEQLMETVAAQTSGFGLRDLQVLVGLALKERFKRCSDQGNGEEDFVLSDFTTIIGRMHKAYSEAIGAPKVPSVLWKDVGGLEHLKVEILRSLRSNQFSSGLKRSGLLLHGPPGTGKTLLAKAVATECSRNFLSVKGPELLNMYVGQSEHNIRDLFELAKTASPCIVFFDELDSLAPNRGRSGDSGGVMDRVVSQLLAEIDDLGDSGDVFILGATNRPDLIDPALLRPGRLDKLLYVGPCEDEESKLSVLTALTHKLKLSPDVNLQEVVKLLPPSVSGAQMSALCSTAWMSSARHKIKSGEHKTNTTIVLNREHFLSAMKSVF